MNLLSIPSLRIAASALVVAASTFFSSHPQLHAADVDLKKAPIVDLIRIPKPPLGFQDSRLDTIESSDFSKELQHETLYTLFDFDSQSTPTITPIRETRGSEDAPAEEHAVRIPEPLLFDLVRPLGARKGELEMNVLSSFPMSANGHSKGDDPFGTAPTSLDHKGIEWAPEIEYAIYDNFAIEFEFPFEDGTLEEYKLGLQWTIGTAFDDHYIHGFQMLIEPNVEWQHWNTTFLYLAGIRFDEVWSSMIMFGGRASLEGSNRSETFERILNASLFADVNGWMTLGIETNFAQPMNRTSDFAVIPQVHLELSEHVQVQSGIGLGFSGKVNEQAAILRLIYSR